MTCSPAVREPHDGRVLNLPKGSPARLTLRTVVADLFAVAVLAVLTVLAMVSLGGCARTPHADGAGDGESGPEPDALRISPEETPANWPRFRGPGGLGTAAQGDPPTSWNGETGEGIVWKATVPLGGAASPVVWGDRIFVAGADEKTRELYCFDAGSGRMLWRAAVSVPLEGAGEPVEVWDEWSHAASTPVTDGRRVCVIFATGVVACFDFSGRTLWTRSVGVPRNSYGHASSLVLHSSLLLIQLDQTRAEDDSSRSKLMALDVASGKTVWETPRPVRDSWSTPAVIFAGGRVQVVTTADTWIISYDVATGAEIWRAKCLEGDVVASPVYADGLVYTVMEMSRLSGVRADGRGDVTETHVAWSVEGDLPSICTPLHDGERLYCLTSSGILTCWDPGSGRLHWEQDTEASFLASPVLAAGRIYMFGDDGLCVIIKAAGEYEEIGRPELGEEVRATPAFVGDRIYARGERSLFCLGRE